MVGPLGVSRLGQRAMRRRKRSISAVVNVHRQVLSNVCEYARPLSWEAQRWPPE